MIENVALILFPAALAFAAFSDLLTMRIPNRVSILLVVSYLALAAWLSTPWQTVGLHVACGVVVLLLALVPFSLGKVGGGDVKLVSAIALWVGWDNLSEYGIYASLAGGLLAITIIAIHWHGLSDRFKSFPFVAKYAAKLNSLPYGVALAIGGLMIYPQTAIWRALAGV